MAETELRRVHGRWGQIYLGGVEVAEATAVEWTVEVDQQEVPQSGGQWLSFIEGPTRGSGSISTTKAYSSFERDMIDFVGKSKAELIALRDAGMPPRRPYQMVVDLDDPVSYGQEKVLLKGCRFWSVTGGYELTGLAERTHAFTFQGIELLAAIPGSPVFPRA